MNPRNFPGLMSTHTFKSIELDTVNPHSCKTSLHVSFVIDVYIGIHQHVFEVCLYGAPYHVGEQLIGNPLIGGPSR